MKIRKSMLEDYYKCPRLFQRRWVLEEPAVVSASESIGTMFHEFANTFFDLVDKSKLEHLKTINETEDYFQTLVKVPTVVEDLCRNFARFEAKHWSYLMSTYDYKRALLYFFPVEREVTFETAFAQGTVDRIDLMSDADLCIGEYKVSSIINIAQIKREVSWYSIWLDERYPGRLNYGFTYNPVVDKHVIFKITKPMKQCVIKLMKRMLTSIQQQNFPRKLSAFCTVCPYNYDCLEEMPEEVKLNVDENVQDEL